MFVRDRVFDVTVRETDCRRGEILTKIRQYALLYRLSDTWSHGTSSRFAHPALATEEYTAMIRIVTCILCALTAVLAAGPAQASFHTFLINEVFSSSDGKVQYVELVESSMGGVYGGSGNGQNLWSGQSLVASSGSTQRSFVFPHNLPSSSTEGRSVLVATQSFAALGLLTPDFIVPDGFFFHPSGTINYANVDTWTYGNLPGDGVTSMDRSGATQLNSPQNFAYQTATVQVPAAGVTEFYNATLNHFFLTADAVEAASIDGGASGPGWERTGYRFKSGGPNAVCRFYGVAAAGGPNGHFYTADPNECAQVKNDLGWHFESLDFAITPAGPGGACPAGLLPVYRAYNHRFAQHDSNHRITADLAAYQQQVAAGWTGEGVVMCAQQ